jgi:hypothetical protein
VRRPRSLRLLAATTTALALTALALSTPPALAHDGEHGAGGQQGPTISSKNVKLLANVPDGGTVRQSDLAFDGTLVYSGNYGGFRIIDVADPEAPRVVSDVKCAGPQGDISVYRGLAFQSVDSPQSSGQCDSTALTASQRPEGLWEGVRIFGQPRPEQAGAGQPRLHAVRLAHPHRRAGPRADRVLIYVSSYPLGAGSITKDCQSVRRATKSISIITVPLADPRKATVSKYDLEMLEPATYNVGGTGRSRPATTSASTPPSSAHRRLPLRGAGVGHLRPREAPVLYRHDRPRREHRQHRPLALGVVLLGRQGRGLR